MFALLTLLRSVFKPSSPPARSFGSVGLLVDVPTERALAAREWNVPAVREKAGRDFAGLATVTVSPMPAIDRLLLLHGHPPLASLERRPILDDENRRAGIRTELGVADPRPDRDRVRALADYSQAARPGHDDQEFAWAAFVAAGGSSMTPWRAFQAGLRAAADRLDS